MYIKSRNGAGEGSASIASDDGASHYSPGELGGVEEARLGRRMEEVKEKVISSEEAVCVRARK